MTATPSRSYPWYGEGIASQPAPSTDLWVGGPGATGRGLPAVCGGVGPAIATIVSPSEDPGENGQVRFLQRTHHATWSPSTPLYAGKKVGDLLATGGRRRNGSDWSYLDGAGLPLGTVDWRGPLPGGLGPSTNVTNTIRRYSNTTGLTVSDAAGGVVHTYSQRCDVAAGNPGGGGFVSPFETWALNAGDQVIWDTVLELENGRSETSLYAPAYGVHNGAGFPQGWHVFSGGVGGNLPATGTDGTGFTSAAQYLGTGPNGGRLWRIFVAQSISSAISNGRAYAYLLRSAASGHPARTVWIHNHVAFRLTTEQGRIYGPLPFTLVGAGQTPILANEDIVFPGKYENGTVVARLDLRDRPPLDFNGASVFAAADADTFTPLHLESATFGRDPPYAMFGAISNDVLTLAASTDATRMQRGYRDGALVGAPGAPIDPTGQPSVMLRVGRLSSSDKRSPLMPIRRLSVFDRVLTDAEMLAVHQRFVAAES